MEANRDEALQCLKKAREAFKAGNMDKARRFANKSKKMYATEEADGNNIV